MLHNLFYAHPRLEVPRPKRRLGNTHVHSLLAYPVIVLFAMAAASFVWNVTLDAKMSSDNMAFDLYLSRARASEAPLRLSDFTSIDVMKLTKDIVANQLSKAEIESLVTTLSELGVKYIAVSMPMDPSADYPSTNRPKPDTAEQFTQNWADAIHDKGLNVLWRGTWSGIEGIYNFKRLVGQSRFPAGTAATAATDGNKTWLGKTYKYIADHPTYFKDGDIWAPLPERTENIFQDRTSFLPHTRPGIQANYVSFFADLKKVSDEAFAAIGKDVYTGWTTNNFTEVNSGWLHTSFFKTAGLTVVDHYGSTHTPQEMEKNIRDIHKRTGKQVFVQEWADYWNGRLTATQRDAYLTSMYAVFQKLADEHIISGFNYWGGWPGTVESIIDKTPRGYVLNARGLKLKEFFGNNQ